MRETAAEAGVTIVTGDTKVVPRGSADQVFITTTGLGVVLRPGISGALAQPGDAIILTGSVGDHGTAVMLAREKLLTGADYCQRCRTPDGDCPKSFESQSRITCLARSHPGWAGCHPQ